MSVTTNTATDKLLDFLDKKQEDIVEAWFSSLYTEDKKMYGDKVRENGEKLYTLIKKSVLQPLSEEEIIEFTYKMAQERTDAIGNISDIVYHVICGRSVLFHYIYNQSGISLDTIFRELDRISMLFDRFCYYSVSKFAEIKDQELQEKVMFIDQTHKDRLTLLGQMSSSFVHEFRNPLTSVMGFIKLLKSGANNQMYLDIIDHELNQLNFRITQFLHTSRREIKESEMEEVLIPMMIPEILDFLYPLIVDVDCELTNHIDASLKVLAYNNELKQVLQNILLNSIDAVKEKEKPRRISIICTQMDNQAVIRIANNGPIIPSKAIVTIFEPFFTTKELGTGIGLYVCKKIIEKHKGSIVCESNKEWTTFSIYLPLGL